MDAESADVMRDTVAFLNCRLKNDPMGATVLLDANAAGIFMGMTDMCAAMVKVFCELLGLEEDEFMKTMVMCGGILTKGL